MNKLSYLLLCLLASAALFAQPLPKKYVLLEHFTNSNCPVCASRNPAFYNLIDDYPDDVHHIAYHPPIPYSGCIFYQANPSENSGRTSVYGINGTPRVALNGVLAPLGGQLLQSALLQSNLGLTSPLSLTVTESGSGPSRTVTIKAKAWADIPPSDGYRLFVAVVEKTILYDAPNNEQAHHDVFRKMLPALEGVPFTPPAAGAEIEFSYDYTVATDWNAAEVYAVAFVQNTATKEVLNSGAQFDAAVSAADEPAARALRFTPNPAQDRAFAGLAGDRALGVEVFAGDGRLVSVEYVAENDGVALSTSALTRGVYFVKITGELGVYVGKFVKG